MDNIKQQASRTLEDLYNRVTGDEDARVCKDIPAEACNDQPRNFFAYLWANLLGKIADEIASAKLVIPWLFGSLGVPAVFTGFLVPIREAGILLPQMLVAAAIRHLAIRKGIWLLGSFLSALSLLGMGTAALVLDGANAGYAFILMLIIFSLSRGLCSVSAKDVLGKTVSKSRRGTLMGWSASLSGLAILAAGVWLGSIDLKNSGTTVFAGLFFSGAVLWILATVIFALIKEQPGATEGGGNALAVAIGQFGLITSDKAFRQFVTARAMLLSVALVPPFYVLIVQASADSNLLGLGSLIIANGLASSLSAPFWGYMGDRSSRHVMVVASGFAGLIGIITFIAVVNQWNWVTSEIGMATVFFILNVMHGGVRLGRKIYLVDMATTQNRAVYVAVSNTIIGVLMLMGGAIGLLADIFSPEGVVFLLGLLSIMASWYIRRLPEVSDIS